MHRDIHKNGSASVWGAIYSDNGDYNSASGVERTASPAKLAHEHGNHEVHWLVYAAIGAFAMLVSIVLSSSWFNNMIH